jgi:hypothetical protein
MPAPQTELKDFQCSNSLGMRFRETSAKTSPL